MFISMYAFLGKIPGIIYAGIHSVKCRDSTLVGKTDFSHKLGVPRLPHALHCHNNRIFWQFGGRFSNTGMGFITFLRWTEELMNKTEMKKVTVGCEPTDATGLLFRSFYRIMEFSL